MSVWQQAPPPPTFPCMCAVALYQSVGSTTPVLDLAERHGPTGSAPLMAGAGAGTAAGARAAGTGKGRMSSAGQGAMRVARLSADSRSDAASLGGVRGGASASAGRSRVRGGEGVGLAVPDDRELLELKWKSDSSTAGSNGTGIATPSESVESETSSSSGECLVSLGSARRPKRSGMALNALHGRPGDPSPFHAMLRKTMMPPRSSLADGSHSFQPLKSPGSQGRHKAWRAPAGTFTLCTGCAPRHSSQTCARASSWAYACAPTHRVARSRT
jgi:hypothetical protein